MLRHDLRRALLSPEPCLLPWFTACCSAWALRKLGTTAPPISLPFPIKPDFTFSFYLCAVLPYGRGYLEDRLSGYWRFLRRAKLQQVLYEMRQSSPHWLDLQLRHGELRKVLHQMRQTQARRRPSVPLRQMRLGARGSKVSPQILPGMRRPFDSADIR